MSQIIKQSTGGGGGGVDSVTGINGITVSPTTGNVVVSGDYVRNAARVTGIDYTQAQLLLLFTPTSDFVLAGVYIIYDVSVGLSVGSGSYSVGNNAPTYDNVANGTTFQDTISGTYDLFTTSNTIITSSTPLFLNISVGATATTLTGRVLVTGSYL